MNNLPRICWTSAAFIALGGMLWGLHMAISGDHSNLAAHAHLNLLGWVSLALYGTYYQLAGITRLTLARLQVLFAIPGSVIMGIGIAIAHQTGAEEMAKIGSLLVIISALLFAVITVMRPLRINNAG
ncbi:MULTISPECIES: hypothetical protein [Thalassospira]|uniref:Uncharacterized protein n=2 Tax=Thalassospira TaxID=168934 RepID=A0A367W3T4_9PROT|nr:MULTISPECIES: hypothetical protein [Thalassospira]MDG4720779.1 hypothetical protein [Thalassospira sp. FZY0004]RCK35023.1 hypothetical protein TH19_14995 [Thalassospira profundimaris]